MKGLQLFRALLEVAVRGPYKALIQSQVFRVSFFRARVLFRLLSGPFEVSNNSCSDTQTPGSIQKVDP